VQQLSDFVLITERYLSKSPITAALRLLQGPPLRLIHLMARPPQLPQGGARSPRDWTPHGMT